VCLSAICCLRRESGVWREAVALTVIMGATLIYLYLVLLGSLSDSKYALCSAHRPRRTLHTPLHTHTRLCTLRGTVESIATREDIRPRAALRMIRPRP